MERLTRGVDLVEMDGLSAVVQDDIRNARDIEDQPLDLKIISLSDDFAIFPTHGSRAFFPRVLRHAGAK